MKKIAVLLIMAVLVLPLACVGPVGPEGPPGRDGINILGEVFEVNVNFTQANNYAEIFDLKPPILPGDMALAYIRWEVDNGTSIWRPLPQVVFHDEGLMQYNFDFSRNDFRLFLETTFSPSLLDIIWTRNQRFRILIIPADLANARMDFSDYEAVMKYIGATEKDFVKLEPRGK
jgi:hypothetical protein